MPDNFLRWRDSSPSSSNRGGPRRFKGKAARQHRCDYAMVDSDFYLTSLRAWIKERYEIIDQLEDEFYREDRASMRDEPDPPPPDEDWVFQDHAQTLRNAAQQPA